MFVTIGVVGVVLLVLALALDDVLDGLLPDSDWLSLPGIAVFLAAFGLGGWALTDQMGAPETVGVVGGTVLGLMLGYFIARLIRGLSTMATDATPRADDLLGRSGKVVTGILPHSSGEVLVELGGHAMKLGAVYSGPEELITGSPIVVTEIISPTRVRVEPFSEFWR